jgi:uncharacterized protein YndB with AHSA1/START domain
VAADPDLCLRLERSFAAPPQDVFDAWTTPELMKRWMFVGRGNDIYKVQADLRVDGAFSILEWSGSEDVDHFGHYRAIEPPHRLAFTLMVPKHFRGRTVVTIEIAADDAGSRVIFEQVGVKKETVETAWRAMFDALAELLQRPQ